MIAKSPVVESSDLYAIGLAACFLESAQKFKLVTAITVPVTPTIILGIPKAMYPNHPHQASDLSFQEYSSCTNAKAVKPAIAIPRPEV